MCTLSVTKALCKIARSTNLLGEVAQLVGCLDGVEKVGGSTPPFSTSYTPSAPMRIISHVLCAASQANTVYRDMKKAEISFWFFLNVISLEIWDRFQLFGSIYWQKN